MKAFTLLNAVDAISRQNFQERARRWVKFSYLIGGAKPRSLFVEACQNCSALDLLICQMEAECVDLLFRDQNVRIMDDVRFNSLTIISRYSSFWISSAYEIFRVYLNEKRHSKSYISDREKAIFRNLSLVRMPLFKHGYAGMPKPKPGQKKNLFELFLTPDGEVVERYHADNKSSAMPRIGYAPNGSVVWECYDKDRGDMVWINRRGLADDLLQPETEM